MVRVEQTLVFLFILPCPEKIIFFYLAKLFLLIRDKGEFCRINENFDQSTTSFVDIAEFVCSNKFSFRWERIRKVCINFSKYVFAI